MNFSYPPLCNCFTVNGEKTLSHGGDGKMIVHVAILLFRRYPYGTVSFPIVRARYPFNWDPWGFARSSIVANLYRPGCSLIASAHGSRIIQCWTGKKGSKTISKKHRTRRDPRNTGSHGRSCSRIQGRPARLIELRAAEISETSDEIWIRSRRQVCDEDFCKYVEMDIDARWMHGACVWNECLRHWNILW